MTKQLLDAILAKLALDFPDTAKTYSPEVFADWLVKYEREAFEQHQLDKPFAHGRWASQGHPQNLPKSGKFGPSNLPKWECCGDSTPRHGTVTVSVPGAFGDLSRYNKDRQPVDVYRAVAEQALSPTGRFPTQPELQELPKRRAGKHPALAAPYGTSIHTMLETEWVHLLGGVMTAFLPAHMGDKAVLSAGKLSCGVFTVLEVWEGDAAIRVATEYLSKLQQPK